MIYLSDPLTGSIATPSAILPVAEPQESARNAEKKLVATQGELSALRIHLAQLEDWLANGIQDLIEETKQHNLHVIRNIKTNEQRIRARTQENAI